MQIKQSQTRNACGRSMESSDWILATSESTRWRVWTSGKVSREMAAPRGTEVVGKVIFRIRCGDDVVTGRGSSPMWFNDGPSFA